MIYYIKKHSNRVIQLDICIEENVLLLKCIYGYDTNNEVISSCEKVSKYFYKFVLKQPYIEKKAISSFFIRNSKLDFNDLLQLKYIKCKFFDLFLNCNNVSSIIDQKSVLYFQFIDNRKQLMFSYNKNSFEWFYNDKNSLYLDISNHYKIYHRLDEKNILIGTPYHNSMQKFDVIIKKFVETGNVVGQFVYDENCISENLRKTLGFYPTIIVYKDIIHFKKDDTLSIDSIEHIESCYDTLTDEDKVHTKGMFTSRLGIGHYEELGAILFLNNNAEKFYDNCILGLPEDLKLELRTKYAKNLLLGKEQKYAVVVNQHLGLLKIKEFDYQCH